MTLKNYNHMKSNKHRLVYFSHSSIIVRCYLKIYSNWSLLGCNSGHFQIDTHRHSMSHDIVYKEVVNTVFFFTQRQFLRRSNDSCEVKLMTLHGLTYMFLLCFRRCVHSWSAASVLFTDKSTVPFKVNLFLHCFLVRLDRICQWTVLTSKKYI